jgi:hypothetical protein
MIDKDFFMQEMARLADVVDYPTDQRGGKFTEYYKAMRYDFTPQSLTRTVNKLIKTFEPKNFSRFPSIGYFYETKKSCFVAENPVIDDGTYRDVEITAAWSGCFSLCWLIKDDARRKSEFENLMLDEKFEDMEKNKPVVLAHYVEKKKNLKSYLESVGITDVKIIKDCIIPETSEDWNIFLGLKTGST